MRPCTESHCKLLQAFRAELLHGLARPTSAPHLVATASTASPTARARAPPPSRAAAAHQLSPPPAAHGIGPTHRARPLVARGARRTSLRPFVRLGSASSKHQASSHKLCDPPRPYLEPFRRRPGCVPSSLPIPFSSPHTQTLTLCLRPSLPLPPSVPSPCACRRTRSRATCPLGFPPRPQRQHSGRQLLHRLLPHHLDHLVRSRALHPGSIDGEKTQTATRTTGHCPRRARRARAKRERCQAASRLEDTRSGTRRRPRGQNVQVRRVPLPL